MKDYQYYSVISDGWGCGQWRLVHQRVQNGFHTRISTACGDRFVRHQVHLCNRIVNRLDCIEAKHAD